MAKKIDYSMDIGDTGKPVAPDYGALSAAYGRYGANMAEATITQGKATAALVETIGKTAWDAKVGYDQAKAETDVENITKQIGTPSEIKAQETADMSTLQLQDQRVAAISDIQSQVAAGTIFADQAATMTNEVDAKFMQDAAKFTAAREQNLISAGEAANRIAALAKERIASQPWAAADIRKTVARLTGMENVEARDFQRALTLEEKAQKAQEQARTFELKAAEEIYTNLPMLFPDMNPAQIADTLAANPQLRTQVMTMAAQRRSMDAAAKNSDSQVKVMANQGTLTSQQVDQDLSIKTVKMIADQLPQVKQFVTEQKITPANYTNADGSTNYQAITTDKAKLEILQSQLGQVFGAHYLQQHAQIDSVPGLTPDQRATMHANLSANEKRTKDMFKDVSGVATQVALLEKYNYDAQKFLQNAQAWNQVVTALGDGNARLQFMLNPDQVRQQNPLLYNAMMGQQQFVTSTLGVNPKTQAEQANINARNGTADPATAARSVPKELVQSETIIQGENRKTLMVKYASGTTVSPEDQVKDARSLAYAMYYANFNTPTGKQELDVMVNGGQLQNVLKNMTPENGAIVLKELNNNIRRSLSYNEGNLSQRIVKEYQNIDKLLKETSKQGLQLVNDANGNMMVKYPDMGNVKGEIAAAASSLDAMVKSFNDLSTQARVVSSLNKGAQLPDAMSEARSVVSRYLQGGAPAQPQEIQGSPSPFSSALKKSENQTKFLDFLGKAEGADFNVIVGGKKFDDFGKHPSVVGLTTKEGPSTAAGKFQITKTTYDQYAKKLGITDFSPESQEKIALAIIEDKGAMQDVEKGNWNAAIKKLGDVWASLPSSPYSQPKRSQEWVKQNLG